jgi:oxygen-independent coproporphyrinogen-3 oxidase
MMNRAHNAAESQSALKRAQDAGFENITIDLMYGLPELSNEEWLMNLLQVSELNIKHLSCYSLTVEEKTALADMMRKNKISAVSEGTSGNQMQLLMQWAAENNFQQYEISNFAKENFYSMHNTAYWQNKKYLGLGPSAHSYNGKSRRWNASNNQLYIQSLCNEKKILFEEENLTNAQRYNEFILTRLRTIWGIDLNKLQQEFGDEFKKYFLHEANSLLQKNLIMQDGNVFTLTTEGKFTADSVASALFNVD